MLGRGAMDGDGLPPSCKWQEEVPQDGREESDIFTPVSFSQSLD